MLIVDNLNNGSALKEENESTMNKNRSVGNKFDNSEMNISSISLKDSARNIDFHKKFDDSEAIRGIDPFGLVNDPAPEHPNGHIRGVGNLKLNSSVVPSPSK